MKKRYVAASAVCFAGWAALAMALDRWGHRTATAVKADCIIILGARVVPPGVAGVSLRARSKRAAQLFAQGVAPRIVCTGGVGRTPPAESIAATNVLLQHGVPEGAILREELSTSTWENAEEAAKVCRTYGWTRVVVVSDAYHLWRATRNFQKMGFEATPAATPNPPLVRHIWMSLREAILVIRDGCVGRL
jgi:uncharacterized SAM-binding protein YcdF (DUF218 family)